MKLTVFTCIMITITYANVENCILKPIFYSETIFSPPLNLKNEPINLKTD